ncbi:MAG: segregation/condensation protein A [Verrucomicrobiota bacterium]|nr:segregation/condensation protein A [Verrucomicrobiota bacterium]
MSDDLLKVKLPVFEGPLDLLLYLIKKDELEIYEIPIEQVTKQYLEYIHLMKMLDLDIAGEFLVMAATLMYIKSRMLLPEDQQVIDDQEEEDEDPRWELVRQLVEYKKFKEAALHLMNLEMIQENIFLRKAPEPQFDLTNVMSLADVGIFDLLNAFNKVLKKVEKKEITNEIFDDRFSVSDKIDFILNLITQSAHVSFSELFEGAASRSEVVVTFLALLEVIRLKQVTISQPHAFSDIQISKKSE